MGVCLCFSFVVDWLVDLLGSWLASSAKSERGKEEKRLCLCDCVCVYPRESVKSKQ